MISYKPVAVPTVHSAWNISDYLGALRVRFSIGRGTYKVDPGLYKLGYPGPDSDIFVTANYKLSYDTLRRALGGMDAWILILDTKGINVWCAAGKGTFGTNELIRQIEAADLKDRLSHRRIILPQLGAPGIAAHTVKAKTGFNVKYGPVRASDIKDYIAGGYKTDEDMRQVRFNMMDRLILTPVELVNSIKYFVAVAIIFLAISGLHPGGYSFRIIQERGFRSLVLLGSAYLAGAFFTPLLLPWLPGRYFAGKGIVMAILGFILLVLLKVAQGNILSLASWFLLMTGISSFLAMNFTGASTYTSLSGVKKEMRIFLPIQIASTGIGFVLFILVKFI